MSEPKKLYSIHYSHLRWRKRRVFLDFVADRRGFIEIPEIIKIWNEYQTRAEDTVFYTEKEVKCCGGCNG